MVDTTLQTIPSSFPRRLSQYLHRCPVFVGGHIRIAANPYTISSYCLFFSLTQSSLPSGDILTCLTDTTILLKQTDASSQSSTQLQPLSDTLPPLHCPLPGLEECYHVLVTTILYHRLYQREIESGSLRLFKGILLSGDHGLGKTQIVSSLARFSLDPRRRRLLQAVSPPLAANSRALLARRHLRRGSARHPTYLFSRLLSRPLRTSHRRRRKRLLRSRHRPHRGHRPSLRQAVANLSQQRPGRRAASHLHRRPPRRAARPRRRNHHQTFRSRPCAASRRAFRPRDHAPPSLVRATTCHSATAFRSLWDGDGGMASGAGAADARLHGGRFGAVCDTCGSGWRNVANGARASAEWRDAVGDEGRGARERNPVGGDRRHGEREGAVSESTHSWPVFCQTIEWPIEHAEQMQRFQLHVPRGILLYGPPGCAKTTLARALASQAHASFWTLSTAQVVSPYVGQSEVGIGRDEGVVHHSVGVCASEGGCAGCFVHR